MFENTPTITPQPNPAATNSSAASLALAQHDQEAIALFERAKLSRIQKVILLIATLLVVVIVVGAGIWLNSFLPELLSTTVTSNTNANTTIKSTSSTVNLASKDTDGDGLTDGDEQQKYKTNPNNKDTDGDGYTDNEEIKNGYDPNGPGKL